VVQAVAGFVEEGDHVVVAEGGGLAAHRAGEVAHQVGDRGLDAARDAPAGDRGVHPGAALLGVAGVEVEVELADEFAIALDAEEAHVGVPHGAAVGLDAHLVERSTTLNRPSSTLGSGKYSFTSCSEKA
jgi:hypothetical protein